MVVDDVDVDVDVEVDVVVEVDGGLMATAEESASMAVVPEESSAAPVQPAIEIDTMKAARRRCIAPR